MEIVASTDETRTRRVLSGVRRTYRWTEEAPFRGSSQPALLRIDDSLELGIGTFTVLVTRPDGTKARGSARRASADAGKLEVSFDFSNRVNGVHAARVEAYIRQDEATIAVPMEGTVTFAE